MDIYEKCPVLENDNFIVRLLEENDVDDLLSVYSDKYALPYFNSDNCNGSNFYCATREHMQNAVKYWLFEYYENRGFVRFPIVHKKDGKVDWFGCFDIITKAAVYAIDRIEALKKMNFIKSPEPLAGRYQNMIYNDYWIRKK